MKLDLKSHIITLAAMLTMAGSASAIIEYNDGGIHTISEGPLDAIRISNGTTLNITGGTFSMAVIVNRSTLNISGGHFLHTASIAPGSSVSISGGLFGDGVTPNTGTVVLNARDVIGAEPISVLISGGTFGTANGNGFIRVQGNEDLPGTVGIAISGGDFDYGFIESARSAHNVNIDITGGTFNWDSSGIHNHITAGARSSVWISGGSFSAHTRIGLASYAVESVGAELSVTGECLILEESMMLNSSNLSGFIGNAPFLALVHRSGSFTTVILDETACELEAKIVPNAPVYGPGDTVILDGSTSTGSSLAFNWSFSVDARGTKIPTRSSAVLSDSTTANASFVADLAGCYTVKLLVTDGFATSREDLVVFVVDSSPSMYVDTMPLPEAGHTITFDEHPELPNGSLIGDAFIDLGVVFLEAARLQRSWQDNPPIQGSRMSNTGDFAGQFTGRATTMWFESDMNSVVFAMGRSRGRSFGDSNSDYIGAFSAYHEGALVESFGLNLELGSPARYFGFTGSEFDELVVELFRKSDGTKARLDLDVLQLIASNKPPVAQAGSDQLVECQGDLTAVDLDGSASSDPDGDELMFEWSVAEESGAYLDNPSIAAPSGMFPVGPTLVTLTVTDGNGGVSVGDVLVTVEDTIPPVLICTTDLIALWPPNHQMVEVGVGVSVTDLCASTDILGTLLLCHVVSDEPDDANGDGEFTGDVDGLDGFSAPVPVLLEYDAEADAFVGTLSLRAERDGADRGRSYSVLCAVSDPDGNEFTSSCVVVVPHDRKKK